MSNSSKPAQSFFPERSNPMEQDYEQLMARLAKHFDDESIISFAQSMFAHNPVGDWMDRSSDEVIRTVQRIAQFTAYFNGDNPHALVKSIESSSIQASDDVQSNHVEENGFSQVKNDLHSSASSMANISPGLTPLALDSDQPTTELLILCKDMPFIVDSVRILMNREQLDVIRQLSSVVAVKRDQKGLRIAVRPASQLDDNGVADDYELEAMMCIQLKQRLDQAQAAALEEKLQILMIEVKACIKDFTVMRKHCMNLAEHYEAIASQEIQGAAVAYREGMGANEAAAFLRWVCDDHFVFLGCRRYTYENGDIVPMRQGSDLGWLTADQSVDLLEDVPLTLFGEQPLYFAKSATYGRIHRPAYPDILRVVDYDDNGQRVGELRFVGLYTSAVYRTSVKNIPIVRRLADNIAKDSDFLMSGYDGKSLWQYMETYPRDEWLQSSFDQLTQVFMKVIALQERPLLRLLVRVDAAYRFVSVMIFVPKDRYTTGLRHAFERVLQEHLPVLGLDFDVFFSESVLARVHIVARVNAEQRFKIDVSTLESEFLEVSLTWEERLCRQLKFFVAPGLQGHLEREYVPFFPNSYKADMSAAHAARDIIGLNSIVPHRRIHLELQRSTEDEHNQLSLKIYARDDLPSYSLMIPILEYLGFHVAGAKSYRLTSASGTSYTVTHYTVVPEVSVATVDALVLQPHLEDAVDRVLSGLGSSDYFNRLILLAGLTVSEVRLLRAYARYMRQIGFNLSYRYIASTLGKHPKIAQNLVKFFNLRFSPQLNADTDRDSALKVAHERLLQMLEQVQGVDDDRILRQYLNLMQSTIRTNYFQGQNHDQNIDLSADLTVNGKNPFLAFKLSPRKITNIPKPAPEFEIFVYSSEVEGVHLRGGPVARGGLRWSDRLEDYRTEVLGLVKAQQVKNAVIVPVGAKGGFVCKRLPKNVDRNTTMAAVKACYQTFIRGLLSVTDNLINGEIVPPEGVVRHDPDDPYLVVAADKGTATFSDLANEVAEQHNFWMGDAFASGGSQGYDHKKMGITARGAWVSVQRHFREIDIDVQKVPFTVIGIGDMAGDVFGNGMLLSETIQLIAAFNHKHIFIDPTPLESRSFEERRRLFNLPQSSWEDYNQALISQGGGVFSRDLKSITITPQMKNRFSFTASYMTPTELIHELMQSKVDLIWNGGIGTYVKASFEENLKVGDKANDALRVNGNQLQCKVFGEGGNLGLTQLGRIEASHGGVLLHTDFIDNAGGVDCSDHEVNIKILLAALIERGELTTESRNSLLVDMTDAVSELVLHNNAYQVRTLSLAMHDSVNRLGEYRRLISRLEQGPLDRALEYLPTDELLHERSLNNNGLTKPELATIMCYAKAELKEALAVSPIAQTVYAIKEAYKAFPQRLVNDYPKEIKQHRLIKQLAATQLSNAMIHTVGITIVQRMLDTTGADINATTSAFLVIKNLIGLDNLWNQIEDLTGIVDYQVQRGLFLNVRRLLRRTMRLLLRQSHCTLNVTNTIQRYQEGVDCFFDQVDHLLKGEEHEKWSKEYHRLMLAGVPETLARKIAACDYGLGAFDIVDAHHVASNGQGELIATGHLYFSLWNRLGLEYLESQIRQFKVVSQWTALAREALLDDLYNQQRDLIAAIIRAGENLLGITLNNADASSQIETLLEAFYVHCAPWIEQWKRMSAEIATLNGVDHPVATVALRELLDLALAARQWSEGQDGLSCAIEQQVLDS